MISSNLYIQMQSYERMNQNFESSALEKSFQFVLANITSKENKQKYSILNIKTIYEVRCCVL